MATYRVRLKRPLSAQNITVEACNRATAMGKAERVVPGSMAMDARKVR